MMPRWLGAILIFIFDMSLFIAITYLVGWRNWSGWYYLLMIIIASIFTKNIYQFCGMPYDGCKIEFYED